MYDIELPYKQKDSTCVRSSMNHRWNQGQEGHHMQSHLHWNEALGTNRSFSPTLAAAVPSSASISNSGTISSSNDGLLSTRTQTLPSFLPQQLVWPTTTMTMNPSFSYLPSMPIRQSQPTFLIPMPVYGCAYPNNGSSNIFHFPPTMTGTQGGGYLIQPPVILPPQPGMVLTETSHSQSMVRPFSNAFPNGSDNPYHPCLSLKIQARDGNSLKLDTDIFEKDDSFLLPQACESSFQSRSANQGSLESPQEEEVQYIGTTSNFHCFEDEASTENEANSSPKAAAAEMVLLRKPRRALSAYNLFFKDQRERMIRRQERKEEEEERQATTNSEKGPKKRGRRRKHGIRFENMARDIAQLWKNVDPQILSKYEMIAEKDKKRYVYEKGMYMQQRMDAMETTREQLEATVSDIARQKYLEKEGSFNNSERFAPKKKKRRVD